jgi:hypothetical protein
MDIKKIIKQTLLEAVTGDASALAGAKGSVAVDTIKDRMASMGVSVPDIEHLFSIQQLKVEPFKLEFVVQKVIDKPQELTLPETEEFSGLAKVVGDSDNLTIEFKPFVNGGLSKEIFDIIFLEKEIVTNLPGTDKSIKALSATGRGGKFYHVQIPSELFELYTEDDEENIENQDTDIKDFNFGGLSNLDKHGNTLTKSQQAMRDNLSGKATKLKKDLDVLKKSGGIDKSGHHFPKEVINKLIQQKEDELNSLIKQIQVTIPKKDGQQLSMFDHYHNLKNIVQENLNIFLEEDNEQLKIKFPVTAEIYLSDIELGSKGKAKKRGDIGASYGGGGGNNGKNANVRTLTNNPISVFAKIKTGVNLSQIKEVQNYVNTEKTLMMRKSNSNRDSIILWFKNDGEDKALVVKLLDPNKNLYSGPLNVEVGTKALGDKRIVDSFNATLQLSPK